MMHGMEPSAWPVRVDLAGRRSTQAGAVVVVGSLIPSNDDPAVHAADSPVVMFALYPTSRPLHDDGVPDECRLSKKSGRTDAGDGAIADACSSINCGIYTVGLSRPTGREVR
jgi:hypothetical protein